jgi:hypothetical protein
MPQARREPGETAFRRARAAAGAVFRPGEGRSVDAAYPQCCTRQPTNVLEIRTTTILASERGAPQPAPAEPASLARRAHQCRAGLLGRCLGDLPADLAAGVLCRVNVHVLLSG